MTWLGARAMKGSAAIAAVGSLTLMPIGVSSARAEVDGSYEAFAAANGFSMVISNQSIPTGIDIEGGGPQAQARQTSLGIGDASAQMPYAGETVPGLPGTGAALLGLPAPPYPFIAATNRGSAPATVSYPGLTLRAESGPFATIGQALLGTDASGASSDARVDEQSDGRVSSLAEAKANTLQVGQAFTISNFRTVASVVADGTSGEIRRSTSTSIGRIFAPGLVLRIPDQTPGTLPDAPLTIPGAPPVPSPPPFPVLPVPSGGQTLVAPDIGFIDGYFVVKLPSDGAGGSRGSNQYIVPAEPVIGAFKGAGVTMTFQAPQEFGDGVVSGALNFEYTFAAPPQNPVVTGPTRVRQSTGAAVATVTLRPFAAGTDAAGSSAGSSVEGAASGANGAGVLPGAGVDSAGLPSTLPEGVVPGSASGLDTVDLVPSAAAGGVAGISFAGFSANSINDLYLVVVAIALLGLATATALRVMGVRSRWMS